MSCAEKKETGLHTRIFCVSTGSDIQWIGEKLTIVVKQTAIHLTPAEYRLLFPLRHYTPVTYSRLAQNAYECASYDLVRSVVEKNIDRIRTKLRGSGVYVYCILGYGYIMLPTHEEIGT